MTTNGVPGFSEGYRLGQAFADMMFSNRGMVIAHRIPGRRRYSCEAIKGRPEICSRIEDLLLGLDGFDSVRVSPVTGSVIAEYSVPEETADLVFDALSHAVAGQHALQAKTLIPTGIVTAGDNIYDIFRGLKKSLLTFFDHTGPAFITRIAGFALLAYGINRVVFQGERPSGTQILFWGLALLLRPTHLEIKDFTKPASRLIRKARAVGGR